MAMLHFYSFSKHILSAYCVLRPYTLYQTPIWLLTEAPMTSTRHPMDCPLCVPKSECVTRVSKSSIIIITGLPLLLFNGHFSMRAWVSWFPIRPSSFTCSRKEPLGLVKQGSSQAGCHSCHPTISVKALKGTESSNTNQCPGLTLYSPITGLPT